MSGNFKKKIIEEKGEIPHDFFFLCSQCLYSVWFEYSEAWSSDLLRNPVSAIHFSTYEELEK